MGSPVLVVACLGDSITEGSPGETTWQEWAAHPSLEYRNSGVCGERTDKIADRLDVAVAGADAVIVQGGINDIAQGRPVERAAENLRAMVRRGKQLGLQVVLVNVLPWNGGGDEAEARIRRLNELIVELAQSERVPLLDFWSAVDDPDASGRMKDEYAHADGDHPSAAGYRRIGESVLDDLLRALQPA
jgi:lysophospholipase L1-like esterase